NWEEPTIIEEGNRPDFVCWIRNQSRAAWALTIPYRMDNETKPMYPDFLIIRSDEQLKYVIDILEPHGPQYTDGLYKAKGMAEYAAEEERIGRIQMIREVKDAATGKKRLRRLDFSKGEVREKIKKAMTGEEFNHIFEDYGTFEDSSKRPAKCRSFEF
ncbi:MAG: restriction endonuclease subunit R, partial [Selenomonas sp.]|nr:restriction endonuclease subunit R [Selenomonas sp.]